MKKDSRVREPGTKCQIALQDGHNWKHQST
jgi:hypothetical protein